MGVAFALSSPASPFFSSSALSSRNRNSLRARASSLPPRPHSTSVRCLASASPTADVVVIGGGFTAFSTALELARSGVRVRIVTDDSRRPPGSAAAAGMLAPNSEGLFDPDMLRLCRQSLCEFGSLVTQLADIVPDVDVGYVACNQFLHPTLINDESITASPDSKLIPVDPAHIEPLLHHSNISTVSRCLDDASVDARALLRALRFACERLGVVIQSPVGCVRAFNPMLGHIQLATPHGGTAQTIHAAHFVVCAGAWTRSLLPMVPMKPIKGQMLSLVAPSSMSSELHLQHVLYGRHCYIVPKMQDGRQLYYVGATVEDVGFSASVTAAGVSSLLKHSLDLVPTFSDFEIEETWAGFRSATPDLLPVLGTVPEFANVSIASGFHRNGALLSPTSGRLMAAVALGNEKSLSDGDQAFLSRFSSQRFSQGGVDVASGGTTSERSNSKGQSSQTSQKENLSSKEERQSPTAPQRKEIKMFKLLKNGSREPVEPAEGWRQQQTVRPSSNDGASFESIDRQANTSDSSSPSFSSTPSPQTHAVESSEQHMSGNTSPLQEQQAGASGTTTVSLDERDIRYQEDVEDDENVSAINDAYDDLLANRNRADVEEHEKLARSMNRAFGRTPSYLEDNENTPKLSISAEEVALYDKALESGKEEMKEFEKCFDPNDPSVIATKKDLQVVELIDQQENADTTQLHENSSGRSSHPFEEQLASDGYF